MARFLKIFEGWASPIPRISHIPLGKIDNFWVPRESIPFGLYSKIRILACPIFYRNLKVIKELVPVVSGCGIFITVFKDIRLFLLFNK